MSKRFFFLFVFYHVISQAGFSQSSGTNLIAKLIEAGPWTLSNTDIEGVSSFAQSLISHQRPVAQFIWEQLTPATRQSLQTYIANAPHDSRSVPYQTDLLNQLVPELNKIIESESLYSPSRFSQERLKEDTRQLVAANPKRAATARLNRMLLEDSYGMIKKRVRIVTEVNGTRFAEVDYKNKFVTFYQDDGSKISSIDVMAQLRESPLGKYGTYMKAENQIFLDFNSPKVMLYHGKVFGDVDVEKGKWSVLGAN